MSIAAPVDSTSVRAWFPSLTSGEIYMDNAGGSQVPGIVADAVRDYMLREYVQVGADYPASQRATRNVAEAHAFVETLFGGEGAGKAILGSSSSTLLRMLADAYADAGGSRNVVVVAESGHEANVSPWLHLAKRGWEVRWWHADSETGVCTLESLQSLLDDRVRVVAFPHVSNILGGIEDVLPCVRAAQAAGARVVVDGVAFAPHLPMRVAEWGVDWYVFSTYKVFGPHMGALWGRHEALAELVGPGHSIVPADSVPYKFELGGVNHEGCAGLNALRPYFAFLAGASAFDRQAAVAAMDAVDALERPLTERFLDFLRSKPVRILGRSDSGPGRLPILSFVHPNVPSKAIADVAAKHGIGMRWGNFYSYRLLERMGVPPTTGVARVSFAHTNTMDEVEKLIAALDPLLTS